MKTLARGPDVLLMRNVDTPFDIHATGVEYSKPSEQGMDEIGSAADYITRQVGERAIFIGTSSWTRRSQVAGDLLGSMLPRVEGIGQFGFTEETGVSSMSLEELARREADGMRDFLYYRQLFLGHNPKKLPPVAVLVATGASIDRHVGFGPAAQGFLDWATQHGATARDGLGMLVEQAAEAFQLWRGLRPPSAQVLQELRAAIAK